MESRSRSFDLWGVPFDGAATLGWPGSRYAPERVRGALSWMTMRAQGGQIYSNDTGRLHPFPATLLPPASSEMRNRRWFPTRSGSTCSNVRGFL